MKTLYNMKLTVKEQESLLVPGHIVQQSQEEKMIVVAAFNHALILSKVTLRIFSYSTHENGVA